MIECPHTNYWTLDNKTVTRGLFKRLAAIDTIPRDRQEHLMTCQCKFCPMEFDFHLQRFEGQGAVLFIAKRQDLGDGSSPLHSELSAVVGPRRIIRIAEEEAQPMHPSPKTRSEKHFLSESFQAIFTLEYKEREEFFTKSKSTMAKVNRFNDSFW